jgi:AbrB family looped-hinge helix DNA binding protein
MQCEAKITSKGQVTIPQEIRRSFNLKQGDIIVFETDEAGVRIKPARSLEDTLAKFAGTWLEAGEEGRTLTEINRDIRDMRGHEA